MNVYTAQFVRDLNGDGIPDIVNIHGGDPFGEPGTPKYRVNTQNDKAGLEQFASVNNCKPRFTIYCFFLNQAWYLFYTKEADEALQLCE